MIFDLETLFSDAQAITGDAPSTNVIDLGATGTPFGGNPLVADFGKGTKIPLYLYITATFDNLTSLDIILQKDDNEGFSSPETVWSHNVLLADLVAGNAIPLPDCLPETVDQRFIRLFFDVNGTNPAAGAITAGVVAARQTNTGAHYG